MKIFPLKIFELHSVLSEDQIRMAIHSACERPFHDQQHRQKNLLPLIGVVTKSHIELGLTRLSGVHAISLPMSVEIERIGNRTRLLGCFKIAPEYKRSIVLYGLLGVSMISILLWAAIFGGSLDLVSPLLIVSIIPAVAPFLVYRILHNHAIELWSIIRGIEHAAEANNSQHRIPETPRSYDSL